MAKGARNIYRAWRSVKDWHRTVRAVGLRPLLQAAILRLSVPTGSCLSHKIACYRCGMSLAALPLPFSRRDACPQCTIDVLVCKMCRNFDPTVPSQCIEDDAEDVADKEKANFCEWFVPSESAFDPASKAQADAAQQALNSLFSEGDASMTSSDDAAGEVEKLFK